MKPTAFAVAAVAAIAAATTADARPLFGAGGCAPWVCGENGTRLTGIALPTVEAKQPIVNAVMLPSGETVDLR